MNNERGNKMKISKYTDKKTNKTMYRVKGYLGTDPITGKKIYKNMSGFAKKRDAEIAERKAKQEFLKAGTINKDRLKFEEVAKIWLETYEMSNIKESTFQIQRDIVLNHIVPNLGKHYVDKITPIMCQSLVNKFTREFTNYSNMIGLATRILEYARKTLKLIDDNPMKDVERPRKARKMKSERYEAPYFSREELVYFLECAKKMDDPKAYAIIHLMSFTGIREGEACGLMWKDFDEVNNTITIERAVIRGKNFEKKIGTTKSPASERTISIDDETAQVLRNWKSKQKEIMFMLGYNTSGKNQFMFTNDKNEIYQPLYAYDRIKAVCKKFPEIGKMTAHGLRHSHVTLLLEAGMSIKEVQERLGHENTKMVLEVYSHINKESSKKIGNDFADFVKKVNG